MPHNLDIGLLRTFATVADRRSMTAAAEVLNLTQGAVSHQIARLEALAGLSLLHRERPSLRLTRAGTRLLAHAHRLVALNDQVWSDLKGGAVAGHVRLGVPIDLVATRFVPVLRSFTEACPDVGVHLSCAPTADLLRDHAAGKLDMTIAEEPHGEAKGEVVAQDRLVWVGARGGSAHEETPLPVSMVTEVCVFRPAIAAALRGREWRATFEHGSLDATIAGVKGDLAVSAWLSTTLQDGLDALPATAGLPDLPVFAITLHGAEGSANPVARELARHIRAGFGEEPSGSC